MKYRVHIKFQCIAYVEAEDRDDAINLVLHTPNGTKLADKKTWLHTSAEGVKRSERDIAEMKRNAALPRWKAAWEMRKAGIRYREIQAKFKRGLRTVAGWVENYEAHLLKIKNKR